MLCPLIIPVTQQTESIRTSSTPGYKVSPSVLLAPSQANSSWQGGGVISQYISDLPKHYYIVCLSASPSNIMLNILSKVQYIYQPVNILAPMGKCQLSFPTWKSIIKCLNKLGLSSAKPDLGKSSN